MNCMLQHYSKFKKFKKSPRAVLNGVSGQIVFRTRHYCLRKQVQGSSYIIRRIFTEPFVENRLVSPSIDLLSYSPKSINMKLHITPKVTSNRINLAFSHPRGTSCRIRSSSSLLIRAAGSGNGRVNKKNPRTPAPSRSPEELAKDFARLKAEFGVVTDLEFKPSA